MASSIGASLRFLVMRPCPMPSVIELPSRSILPSFTYLSKVPTDQSGVPVRVRVRVRVRCVSR